MATTTTSTAAVFATVFLDEFIEKYIANIRAMSKSTANVYKFRLKSFNDFILHEYDNTTSLETLIKKLKNEQEDPYDVLIKYIAYLQSNRNLSSLTLKQWVVTAKNFLEYHDVEISPRKFKLKVKLPKIVRKEKVALCKEDIIEILNACSDIRLKTYVMLLAATGMRAVEALSIRIKDIDFESNPVKLFIHGENTKTKVDRSVYLTSEVAKQISSWLDYKYRTRRVCYTTNINDSKEKRTTTEYRTPTKNPNDLVFTVHQNQQHIQNIYTDLCAGFDKTLDRIGMGTREEDSPSAATMSRYQKDNETKRRQYYRRRQITLHSFRRFVKTTISDLGYSDFSEWFIGHNVSTYWRKKESEKAEIFRKVEPYLTFLDFAKLEAKGADVETKLQDKDKQIQAMNEKYDLLQSQIQTIFSALSNADQSSKNELSKQLLQNGFFEARRMAEENK
jgi:integrase